MNQTLNFVFIVSQFKKKVIKYQKLFAICCYLFCMQRAKVVGFFAKASGLSTNVLLLFANVSRLFAKVKRLFAKVTRYISKVSRFLRNACIRNML